MTRTMKGLSLRLTLVVCFVAMCSGENKIKQGGISAPRTERELILESFLHKAKPQSSYEDLSKEQLPKIRSFLKDVESPGRDIDEFLASLKRAMDTAQSKAKRNEGRATENLDQCMQAIDIVSEDATKLQLYALKMFDSWAVPESGILEGNVRWTGHFKECRTARNRTIQGRWCNSFFGFRYEPIPLGYPIDITLASCFPDICSEESVQLILEQFYNESPFLQHVMCPPTKRDPLTAASATEIAFAAFFLYLVLIGTTIDVTLRAKRKSNPEETEQKPAAIGVQIMLCFSAISNGEKILDMTKRPGTIPVLDGIRVFSMTWVALGHSYQSAVYVLDNASEIGRLVKSNASMMAIINGTFSVDTFFFLSGLLVAYLGIKHLNKTKGYINIPLMYLQRYLRLTPAYAFGILFSIGLYRYCGSGPYWADVADRVRDQCINVWYTNLLYINNFYPSVNYCYAVGWYLANDMQFYILSPIFILAFYRSKMAGSLLIGFVCIGSMLTTGLLTYFSELQPIPIIFSLQTSVFYRFFVNTSVPLEMSYSDKFEMDTYTTPWCRISVYMIGMATGLIIYETKGKIKMHWAVALAGWISAAAIACSLVYSLFPQVRDFELLSRSLATFFETMARPMWALCLTWLVLACVSGYGGPVTAFLGWSAFKPLSRLTYSAFLTHWLVLMWYVTIQETPFHLSHVNVVYYFFGTLFVAFGTGFVLAICIEWPIMGLVKLAFSGDKSKPKKATSNGNNNLEEKPVASIDVERNKTEVVINANRIKKPEIHYNGGFVSEKQTLEQTAL